MRYIIPISLACLTLSFADEECPLPLPIKLHSEKNIPAPVLDPKDTKSKVVSLFNGKDLKGWRVVGSKGKFTVGNGCIVGEGKDLRANSFLRTEKTYKDFIFSYQIKFDHLKGNSGVMFRASQKPSKDGKNNGRVFGYQSEADNNKDRAWTAGLYDESRRGWLYPSKKKDAVEDLIRIAFTKEGRRLFKWNDWNTITIRCKGNHVQIWLNGVLRTNFKDPKVEKQTLEGFFGLQVHSGKACKVRWKNLLLKEIPKDTEKKDAKKAAAKKNS